MVSGKGVIKVGGWYISRAVISIQTSIMSPIRRLWSTYLRVLERRPLRTQMVQSFVVLSTGDVIAQKFVEGRDELEAKRVMRFGAIGCFLIVSSKGDLCSLPV